MARLSDSELKSLGIETERNERGSVTYLIPCYVCGNTIKTRKFSISKQYLCGLCKKDVLNATNAAKKKAKEEHDSSIAELSGTDYEHYKRFESGASKFGSAYDCSIDKARRAINKFGSVPEVVACIELLHIGERVIAQQKVGGFTVDFCLPDRKIVIEIDGSIYHADETRAHMRDYAICNMLGDGWVVRHIPAEAVSKDHAAFGRGMKKLIKTMQ